MTNKKPPTDPDALLQSLLAEADPTILARFTGQAPVEAAVDALDQLGAGKAVTVETSLDVGELDILDVSEASAKPTPAAPVSEGTHPAAEQPTSTPDGEAQTVRADGLPVAVVDLWGDLDESSPPVSAPPTIDEDADED